VFVTITSIFTGVPLVTSTGDIFRSLTTNVAGFSSGVDVGGCAVSRGGEAGVESAADGDVTPVFPQDVNKNKAVNTSVYTKALFTGYTSRKYNLHNAIAG
jgi:hypothetical protein